MATVEAEQKVQLSESYAKARNDFFHRVVKWFYNDQIMSEVSDINFKGLKLNNLVSYEKTDFS
jgi:hypothetical protein